MSDFLVVFGYLEGESNKGMINSNFYIQTTVFREKIVKIRDENFQKKVGQKFWSGIK